MAGRITLLLAALADEPLAEFPQGWGVRMASDRAFAAAGVTRTITYEINDTAIVTEFVATDSRSACCRHRWSTRANSCG